MSYSKFSLLGHSFPHLAASPLHYLTEPYSYVHPTCTGTHTHLQQEKHLSMLENAFCHILWDAETSAGCCRMILILNALTGSNRIEAQQNFLSIYLNLFFQDSIHFLFLMLLSTSFHVPSLPLMFLSHPFFIPSPPWHQLSYFQTFFAWYQICQHNNISHYFFLDFLLFRPNS